MGYLLVSGPSRDFSSRPGFLTEDDDGDDDERSTLEDLFRAKQWSILEDLWPRTKYNFKSADIRILMINPAKKLLSMGAAKVKNPTSKLDGFARSPNSIMLYRCMIINIIKKYSDISTYTYNRFHHPGIITRVSSAAGVITWLLYIN